MEILYAYTILYVKDLQKTIEFYEKALGFHRKFITAELDYGEIKSGTTTIASASLELGKANFKKGFKVSTLKEQPFGIELAFTSLKVDEVIVKALENGAELLSDAVTKPWGQTVAYLRDPNGFILEICTPMNNQ